MKKFLLAVAIAISAIALPVQLNAQIVINEIYAGGGNAGSPFNQDFIEIFNNGAVGSSPIDISGFTLEYKPATAAGTFSNLATIPSGTFLAAGQSYVIAVGPVGGTGVAVPSNLVGASTNLATAAGAVRLFNLAMMQVDLVGYGSATNNVFEGLAPAPGGSNTMSISRTAGLDTNQNGVDFTTMVPTPIPEPGTYMLLGIGVLMCAQQFRRRNRIK
jgi:hypothetical protein